MSTPRTHADLRARLRFGLGTILSALLAVGTVVLCPQPAAHAAVSELRTALPQADADSTYPSTVLLSSAGVTVAGTRRTVDGSTWSSATIPADVPVTVHPAQYFEAGHAYGYRAIGGTYYRTDYDIATGLLSQDPVALPGPVSMTRTMALYHTTAKPYVAYDLVNHAVISTLIEPTGTGGLAPFARITADGGILWRSQASLGPTFVAYAASPFDAPGSWVPLGDANVAISLLFADAASMRYSVAGATGLSLCTAAWSSPVGWCTG